MVPYADLVQLEQTAYAKHRAGGWVECALMLPVTREQARQSEDRKGRIE